MEVTTDTIGQQWHNKLFFEVRGGASLAVTGLLFFSISGPITTLTFGTASTAYIRQSGRFGDVSYGLYLYAFPVQQTLLWLYKDRLSWATILGLVSATTLCLAFASWHLVEKRALQLKPRKSTTVDISGAVAICLMIFVVVR